MKKSKMKNAVLFHSIYSMLLTLIFATFSQNLVAQGSLSFRAVPDVALDLDISEGNVVWKVGVDNLIYRLSRDQTYWFQMYDSNVRATAIALNNSGKPIWSDMNGQLWTAGDNIQLSSNNDLETERRMGWPRPELLTQQFAGRNITDLQFSGNNFLWVTVDSRNHYLLEVGYYEPEIRQTHGYVFGVVNSLADSQYCYAPQGVILTSFHSDYTEVWFLNDGGQKQLTSIRFPKNLSKIGVARSGNCAFWAGGDDYQIQRINFNRNETFNAESFYAPERIERIIVDANGSPWFISPTGSIWADVDSRINEYEASFGGSFRGAGE